MCTVLTDSPIHVEKYTLISHQSVEVVISAKGYAPQMLYIVMNGLKLVEKILLMYLNALVP